MSSAIKRLSASLLFEASTVPTHCTLVVSGWELERENVRAIAHYLVGVRACAMDAALNIRAELVEDSDQGRLDIISSVHEVVGSHTDALTGNQIRTERNPWIAESIWHLCMAIAATRHEFHPLGRIILLDYAHIKAKDHGLDVAAIYTIPDGVGISLVETKAYRDNPNGAISDAVSFFRDVDRGKHSTRIRQAVQIMRTALPVEQRRMIAAAFWRKERAYICNPHYDTRNSVDWTRERRSFDSLEPGPDHTLVMPHDILDFGGFFDAVSVEMRNFAENL